MKAQSVAYLEKKVSLNRTNSSLSDILKEISKQTGVIFSYNPEQLNDKRIVTISVKEKPVRLVLDQLLKGSKYTYKQKKNYILLVYTTKTEEAPAIQTISGYIYNRVDSSIVSNASVYIVSGRRSVLSDQFGYFSLSYPKQQNLISISVARENFYDTTLILLNPSSDKLFILLSPVQKPNTDTISPITTDSITQPVPDTLNEEISKKRFVELWLKLKDMRANMRNINDTLFSDYSVSFFPPLSTNRLLAVNTMNKVSFNILAGSSKGVKYFELGGLLNIDNGNVSYGQIAGLGNVVSGDVAGVQVGGLFNTVRTSITGVQVAGIFNKVHTVKGVQVGGIFNAVSQSDGVQTAGIFNSASGSMHGFQLGGIFNITDTLQGMQLAGIFNKASKADGIQLAGIYNRVQSMKGVQIALINFADTLNGIPIGLFSYVKSGYHKLEISGNELGMLQVGFRSGIEHFHNIFFAGWNPGGSQQLWTYGYGIGSSLQLKNRWRLFTEISAQQIQPVQLQKVSLSLLSKMLIGVEFVCTRHIRIAVGPSFNIFTSDTQGEYYKAVSSFTVPLSFYSNTQQTINTKMWAGATFSLRLF